jgi:putative DNA primase/helicase
MPKLAPVEKLIVPAPSNPIGVGKMFLDAHYADDLVGSLVRHHRNTFHSYDGTSWPEFDERRLQSDLYRWLDGAKFWKKTKDDVELVDFEPTRYKIADLIDAIRALTHLDMHIIPPAWIVGEDVGPVVPVANGLLTIETRKLIAHTPTYFSPHVLPFEYDATAPRPARWLRFLEELWPEDEASRDALAEVMGYVLGGGTELQKIFMLVGPLRSGKGTIGRVLTGLLGAHNVAAPTLAGLTTNFGLSPLIGRPLGLISDARLSTRADGSVAVERLLSISGEDSLTIDRKYRDPWTGRLPTRFVILTNEVPRFTDASGALASRFIMLILTNSFFGREDPGLTDALLAEAPGIFNWALDGLDRLNARGYFEQPESSRTALQRLQDLASPVSAFARDRCVINPDREIEKDALWTAWKDWCVGEGKDRAGTKALFYRDLHAAYPGLREVRLRQEGQETRRRLYRGIDLRAPDDPDDDQGDRDPGDEAASVLAKQLTGPRPIPAQASLGQGAGQDGEPETRRSDGMGRDGPGSSALYPPELVPIVRETLDAHEGNGFAAAFELNQIGLELPLGRATWTATVIDHVLNGGAS